MRRPISDVMAPVRVRLRSEDTLRDAARALRAGTTGLGVVDGPQGEGVITERDLLRAVAGGVDLDSATVGDHMSTGPAAVTPASSVSDACDLMIERGVRHLLVREGAQLVGVVNMRDIVGVLSGAATLGEVPPARGS